MPKNDLQCGWWNSYTLQCGTIVTLISPGDCTVHPAVWHVALESRQWIHQVAAPYNVIHGSGMTCHWIRPNVRHIGILHLLSISTTSPQSTCHSAPVSETSSKSDHPQQKKGRRVDFKDGGSQSSWILGVQWWVLWKAHVRLPIDRQ